APLAGRARPRDVVGRDPQVPRGGREGRLPPRGGAGRDRLARTHHLGRARPAPPRRYAALLPRAPSLRGGRGAAARRSPAAPGGARPACTCDLGPIRQGRTSGATLEQDPATLSAGSCPADFPLPVCIASLRGSR